MKRAKINTSSESDSEDDGYSCIELPTLIRQLRCILDQYSDDGQILKELIQNAEDAEATEVKVMYDGRTVNQHIDPKLLKKRKYLASLTAPALCVYNNAKFAARDWKGIKMLQQSVKELDPLRVGRFGLGFKSVFHMTDHPCVVSGDTVLFLNPKERNTDKVCYMKKLAGLDPNTRRMLGAVLNGSFGFSTDLTSFPGTLFWFPLRREASGLSDNIYDRSKVMDLFQAFQSEAATTLLFLRFIEKIELFENKTSSPENVFRVQLTPDCQSQVRDAKGEFVREVKDINGGLPPQSVSRSTILGIETRNILSGQEQHQDWLVVYFYKGGLVSENLRLLNDDKSLSYCPLVGVAVPLGQSIEGQVFCFLPLPLERTSPTGLPIHVNGFFALSQNRRYVRWPTADQQLNNAHTDTAIQWNRCMVSEVLPEVYCMALKQLVDFCKSQGNPVGLQQQVYSLITPPNTVNINWRPLIVAALREISNLAFLYTPAHGGSWIKPEESLILDEQSPDEPLLTELYSLYDVNLVLVPQSLLYTLKTIYGRNLRFADRAVTSQLLRAGTKYESLTREKKMALLLFLGDYEHLAGLELLPLTDGTFGVFGYGSAILCDCANHVQLFPGNKGMFVDAGISTDVYGVLLSMVNQGVPSLIRMTPRTFPKLLNETISRHVSGTSTIFPNGSLDSKWLKSVWRYMVQNSIDVMSLDVPIIPDVDKTGNGKVYSTSHTFIAQSVKTMPSLPKDVTSALRKLGVVCLAHVPDYVLEMHNIQGTIIHYPTADSVLRCLDELRTTKTSLADFNQETSRKGKEALLHFVCTVRAIPQGAKAILRKLKLFVDTDDKECELETVGTLAPIEELPVPYPERFIRTHKRWLQIALDLGAIQTSFEEICLSILKSMRSTSQLYNEVQTVKFMKFLYNEVQTVKFMKFLMTRHLSLFQNQQVTNVAMEIPFVTSENEQTGLKASELFDAEDKLLRDLFKAEDKFPKSEYFKSSNLKQGLKYLGLKQRDNLSSSDILSVVAKVESLCKHSKSSDALLKMKSLMKYLDTHTRIDIPTDLQHFKCIPSLTQKPRNYPKSLPLSGMTKDKMSMPSELFSQKYVGIVGSVCAVAEDMSDRCEVVFHLERRPPCLLVVQHLGNVCKHYDRGEHAQYMMLLDEIYKFLSACQLSWEDFDYLTNTKSVFTEHGFQYPRLVYLQDNDLDLRPYRYKLPASLHKWADVLVHAGCQLQQTPNMLVEVMHEISLKHSNIKASNSRKPIETQKDLKLIIQIVGALKDLENRPDGMLLPTHQDHKDYLVLLSLDQVTYCNADWLKGQTADIVTDDDDSITFVNADISENTAQELGVSSLTDRVMSDTDELDLDYQQSEPLTKRINHLLKEYTDGFSVPKELIQNADDAGATEVSFMYDERQNFDARKFLLHDGMGAFQGPALWAFNNALFTKSDFQNIVKLCGATKESDETKVGKFGLGFNSVYNLSDVPSFISGSTVVIFDPHGNNLGRKGLKANLKSVKNQIMLRKMYGQFKPFDKVFGCQMAPSCSSKEILKGTLFRLPLRTDEQAELSDIKKLSYSRTEMEKFLRVFHEACGNLVLFTQNVKSIKLFHLPRDGNPQCPELMIHVQKGNQTPLIVSPYQSALENDNILTFVNKEWKRNAENGQAIVIHEKCQITLNTKESSLIPGSVTGSDDLSWHITWATGTGDSADFAMSNRLKGLLPLSAIAVNLTKGPDYNQFAFQLSNCPTGFYREGHVFCFLPLPVRVPFPVHINGTFALTSDRRQLCEKTEDDKMNAEAEWNEALMTDAVCRAYVETLVSLTITPEDVGAFYHLWPMVSGRQIERVFCEMIIESDVKIFAATRDKQILRQSFGQVRYLDQGFSVPGTHIRQTALKAAEHFWNIQYEYLIELPNFILESFKSLGFEAELGSRCFSIQEFYETIFFPNISNSYWEADVRDSLTQFALDTRNSDISNLIKQTACIPTKPHGTLKKPCDLVDPFGKCHKMFSEEDERYPQGDSFKGFATANYLKLLFDLGMVHDDLPSEMLIERAESVNKEPDTKCGVNRYQEIIHYLSHTEYSSTNFTSRKKFYVYSEDTHERLEETPFIPILQRPQTWPSFLPWQSDKIREHRFARAGDLFSDSLTNVVGCTGLVIDLGDSSDILSELGLSKFVPPEIVISQIQHIAQAIENTKDSSKCWSMCRNIYEYLDEVNESFLEELQHQHIICVGQRMLPPNKVAFSLPHDLSPYLFQVENSLYGFKKLFTALGVRSSFNFEDVIGVMHEIKTATGLGQLSPRDLKCLTRLSSCLLDLLPCHLFSSGPIHLPGRDGLLHEASTLCLDDCEWVDDDCDSMVFIDGNFHPKVARYFGVKGKRDADLSSHVSFPDWCSPFGQNEALVTRLKRILSGYPCDVSIMKELLQNADDADATELMFIKDFRSLPCEKIFNDNWTSLQGPALCVYNNSFFSDKDLDGIQKLGIGSKGEDPVKTGQYGVGFNAVYHLTDVPSFMTVGPSSPKKMCVLDPHIKYFPGTKTQPGGRIDNLDRLRQRYQDVFAGFLEDSLPLSEKGTLFRFPLRTEEMAQESEISKNVMTPERMTELLEFFKGEMPDCLLFLHNIKKITVASVNNDGKLVQEYSVNCEMEEDDINKQKGYLSHLRFQAKNVKDHATGIGISDISPLEIQLSISITDSNSKHQKWLIVHRSGFVQDKEIPQLLQSSWEKGDIGLLPRGGVAVPLSNYESSTQHSGSYKSKFEGKTFCILPLPIKTGLPLHVNGHFALDHEARRNLWHDSNDYRSLWNSHTMLAIIIPAYISAIQALKRELRCTENLAFHKLSHQLRQYYLCFPTLQGTTDKVWRNLVESFYLEIFHRRSQVFGVLKPSKGKYSDYLNCKREDIIGKVQWVSISVQKGFPGFINSLDTYFDVKKETYNRPGSTPSEVHERYTKALADSQNKSRILKEVLIDLNMKIIEAPEDICDNVTKCVGEDDLNFVTPEKVLIFLKSDSCDLDGLPKDIKNTPMKSISTAELVTEFIARPAHFIHEINALPLAVTMSERLQRFDETNPIIVTDYSKLLTKKPDIVLHSWLTGYYISYIGQSESLKRLSLPTLTELMPQLLDQRVFCASEPIPWDAKTPTVEWIRQLWNCLQHEVFLIENKQNEITRDYARHQLQSLEDWCLFPITYGSTNDHLFLWPVKKANHVIDNSTAPLQSGLDQVILKMKVPIVQHSKLNFHFSRKLTAILVARFDRPNSVLFALSEAAITNISGVPESVMDTLLLYFNNNVESLAMCDNATRRLMSLPIFPVITGTSVSFTEKTCVLVENSYQVPIHGLKEWMEETGRIIVRYNWSFKLLYNFLNQQPWSVTQLYSEWFIPHFHCFPSSHKSRHIKFIRDNILSKSQHRDYSEEQTNVIHAMKQLKFIEISDGTLHRACEFYNKKNKVFAAMCPPSAFPPPPYDNDEWHTFLLEIGMQCDVTVVQFVEFAKQVAKKGRNGITEEIARLSKLLTSHLLRRPKLTEEGILYQIRDIQFLLPFRISVSLAQIYPQVDAAMYLVCYSECLPPRYHMCVWTSRKMFGENCDPRFPEAYNQLCVDEEPFADDVVKHVVNICSSIDKLQLKGPIQDTTVMKSLHNVMTDIYQFFQEREPTRIVQERLKSESVILLPEERIMVKPKMVVTRLSLDDAIPEYLYPGPCDFGVFYPLFHRIGASESVSAEQYGHVLNTLRDKVSDNEMHPNELKVAATALEKMLHYLEKDKKTGSTTLDRIGILHLPSHSNQMLESKDMVYMDNSYLADRVSSLGIKYFIGFKEIGMKIHSPGETVKLIPENLRPAMLSDIVSETIAPDCKDTGGSTSLMPILESPEFTTGLLRLINHSLAEKNIESLDKSKCEEIEAALQKMNVYEVNNLQSVVVYRGEIVRGSKASAKCATAESDDGICIYVSSDLKDMDALYTCVSTVINRITGGRIGEYTNYLMAMLKKMPSEILEYLDQLSIMAFEYSCQISFAFPTPGTIVPERFHFMLDNSFGYFAPGEYAGFEVFDELIDESPSGEDMFRNGVFIVYVKIKEVLERGDSPVLGRYLIEGKEGTKEVYATQLYKFFRDIENTCTDVMISDGIMTETPAPSSLKEILREIRKTLKDAWALLNERERNRVKKRLFLKWHPDKNPTEKKELCTEVCQYISIYVDKLEKGLDIDEEDEVTPSWNSSDYSWFRGFEQRTRTHRNFQFQYGSSRSSSTQYGSSQSSSTHRGYSGYGFGHSWHDSARNDPNPDAREARRWLRQAKADAAAARDVLSLSTANNWICLMAQQAVEKALKAMLYKKDANLADITRTHVLTSIAGQLGDPVLVDLASSLQTVILDFERLRYPDRLTYPSIPADAYTGSDARTACDLAERVVTYVGEQMA